MIKVDIPGRTGFDLKYAVFDFNGTMAINGVLDKSCIKKIEELSERLEIYILSSDTYRSVEKQCAGLPVKVINMNKNNGSIDKMNFVNQLGRNNVVCIGNGSNDSKMFEVAEFSIVVLGNEGCSQKALLNSDILVKDINDCLEMLLNTDRIVATLRE